MKLIWSLLLSLSFLAFGCGNGSKNTTVENNQDTIQSVDSAYMANKYGMEKFGSTKEGVLDTLLPFFAKLHDSIPFAKRFDTVYRHFMSVHKMERRYHLDYFAYGKDGYEYYMVSRLEPSLKSDKYSSLCFRISREMGDLDTSSYEELFWTWKMRMPELRKKSAILFKKQVEEGDVSAFYPDKDGEEFIMFPDGNAYFDKVTKTWSTRQSIEK